MDKKITNKYERFMERSVLVSSMLKFVFGRGSRVFGAYLNRVDERLKKLDEEIAEQNYVTQKQPKCLDN